jgi:hypothetical protein
LLRARLCINGSGHAIAPPALPLTRPVELPLTRRVELLALPLTRRVELILRKLPVALVLPLPVLRRAKPASAGCLRRASCISPPYW